MSKKVNKILWHGNERGSDGKAKAPNLASAGGDGTDGLNRGEVFINDADEDPAIFIRTDKDKVARIGGGDGASDSYTRAEVDALLNKKVDNTFFSRLFGLMGETGAEIAVNDVSSPGRDIKAKLGLWTEEYLSALGKNAEAGGTVAGATKLSELSDVSLGTLVNGQALVWNGSKWVNQLIESGLDTDELEEYLTSNNYVTQSWATGQFAKKSITITAGTGLTGGGDLSANRTLSLATVGTAGTYTKVTVDAYGRVTGHSALAAADIPALSISKITGLQSALDKKLDAATFDDLFEKVEISTGVYAIRAKYGLYSDDWVSVMGANPDAGGTSSGVTELSELSDVSLGTLVNGQSLVWNGSKWVNQLIESGFDTDELEEYLTSNNYAKKSDIPSLSGYATQSWVNTQLGNYATTSSMNTALSKKVDKVDGKGLSSNDFTDALLSKLNGIEAGANKYVLPTASSDVLGGVKVGTTLAISSGVLNVKSVGTAGTYTKVTTNAYGQVTNGTTLSASDIPNLPWSKITSGKPTTLAGYGITDFVLKSIGVVDYNTITTSGIYRLSYTTTNGATNGPSGNNWGQMLVLYGGGDTIAQLSIGYQYSDSIKYRSGNPSNVGGTGSWSSWKTVIDNNNVGSYALTPSNYTSTLDSRYVKKSGDTMTGALTVAGLITASAGLTTSQYVQIGSGRIKWDATNKALYVEGSDGTAIGFYSNGYISAKGANDDAGGTVTGVTLLRNLNDVQLSTLVNGQALVYDSTSQKWVNRTIESGLDTEELAAYLTENNYATQSWVTGQGYLKSVSLSTISDLHASWDALLKAAPSAYVTRWPTAAEVGALTQATADGRYAYKGGSNATGTWPISISGNAATASKWATARTITLTGAVTGSVSIDGSGNVSMATTYATGNISALDSRYVNVSGDTMTGGLTMSTDSSSAFNSKGILFSGNVSRVSSSTSNLGLYTTGSIYLRPGCTTSSISNYGLIVGTSSITYNSNKVWHAGNDGSGSGLDADLLDGAQSSRFFLDQRRWIDANTNAYNLYDLGVILNATGNGTGNSNWPEAYGVLLNFPYTAGSANYRIQMHVGTSQLFRYRVQFDSANTGWLTLARTTDNVASATKLQTARTLWGQSFNGTANVSGALSGATTISASGRITSAGLTCGYSNTSYNISTASFICQSWVRTTGATGWYNETYGGGIYMTDSTWIRSYQNKAIFTGNSTRRAYYCSGGYSTDWNNSVTYSASNILNVEYALLNRDDKTVSANNTCQPVIVWCNTVSNYGYRTRYSISSVRTSTWGSMRLSVGNSDAGNSIGAYIDIHGGGTITLGGTTHGTGGIYSDSYVSALGQNTSSDIRLKTKLSDIALSLKDIANAPSMLFAWKKNGMKDVGSSAQYWKNILPDAVKERDGWLEMAYGNIALVSSISLAKHVMSHEERIRQLENENRQLKEKIAMMERRAAWAA